MKTPEHIYNPSCARCRDEAGKDRAKVPDDDLCAWHAIDTLAALRAEVARLTKALAQIGQWPCSEGYEGRECPDQPEQNGWLCATCYARRALAGGGK